MVVYPYHTPHRFHIFHSQMPIVCHGTVERIQSSDQAIDCQWVAARNTLAVDYTIYIGFNIQLKKIIVAYVLISFSNEHTKKIEFHRNNSPDTLLIVRTSHCVRSQHMHAVCQRTITANLQQQKTYYTNSACASRSFSESDSKSDRQSGRSTLLRNQIDQFLSSTSIYNSFVNVRPIWMRCLESQLQLD